jgi:GTP-binding protein
MLNLHRAEFIRSAVKADDFPTDGLPQIVFAGKSNVGKSSCINRVLGRKNFARVGNEPGKTVHINFFLIDRQAYLVDLPGYGYARVSKHERERWGRLMETYFASGLLTLGIQLVDIRHKPTADDVTMCNWFLHSGMPFVVIANKLDKIKKSELAPNLALIRQTLALPEDVPIIPFSSQKGDGRETVVELLQRHAAPPEEEIETPPDGETGE